MNTRYGSNVWLPTVEAVEVGHLPVREEVVLKKELQKWWLKVVGNNNIEHTMMQNQDKMQNT